MASTMQFSSLVFPTGNQVPGTSSGTFQVPDGSSQQVNAALTIDSYLFIFWNVDLQIYITQSTDGTPDPQQVVNFTAPSEELFYATSWYVAGGAGGASEPGVTALAFSVNNNGVVPNSPLGSVSSAGAQDGPNTVSTTTSDQAVIITAADMIPGYGSFDFWLLSGDGNADGPVLTVPAGGASSAIAFYTNVVTVPQPDPCAGIRAQIGNLNRGDFPSQAAYERVLQILEGELRQCEEEHGEPPAP